MCWYSQRGAKKCVVAKNEKVRVKVKATAETLSECKERELGCVHVRVTERERERQCKRERERWDKMESRVVLLIGRKENLYRWRVPLCLSLTISHTHSHSLCPSLPSTRTYTLSLSFSSCFLNIIFLHPDLNFSEDHGIRLCINKTKCTFSQWNFNQTYFSLSLS